MIDRSRFEPEDFLVDNTFQLYCSGTDKLSVEYWAKYIHAHPEQAGVIAEAKRLYFILSGNKRPLDNQLEQFKADLENPSTTLKVKRNFTWLKIAAAIVLVAGIGYLYQKYTTKSIPAELVVAKIYTTKGGERKKITLPDGTTVMLNAKSVLAIGKEFNDKCREVNLKGEAFFDVTHSKDKPFKVYTEDFNINVLGTAFNVKAYPDEVSSEATLIRGVIAMEATKGEGGIITLKPSQKVTFYKVHKQAAKQKVLKPVAARPEIVINHYTKINDNTIVETAWTKNRIEIYDQDFDEIRNVLEKWYNVKIKFTDPEVEKFRFTLTIGEETIEQVLQALQQAENNFKYEIKRNEVIISK
ncbi:FecR family protein [Pedobacter sp. MW01-1-1]|uniref:FecR family protein n=1 Tax=Pedobacter sp. MW01-1-1 TaxID=3383027 RepID=UPI003FEDF71A